MSLPLLNQRPANAIPTCCQLCGRNRVNWYQGKPSHFAFVFEDAHAEYRYVCRRCFFIGTTGQMHPSWGLPDGIDQLVITLCQSQHALVERFRRDSVDVPLPDGGVLRFRPPRA